tara:strand:- start:434 stop:682 length:249 start_codon:yes stop_codon:yes gene_type:complete
MKIRVRKETEIKDDPCYYYTCADDGGTMGMCYESILRMHGMAFGFSCGICDERCFMALEQLNAATSECEFKDGVGLIEISRY